MKLRKTDKTKVIMFLNFLFLFSVNIDSSDRTGQRMLPFIVLLTLVCFFIVLYLEQIADWMNNGIFIWYVTFVLYVILSLIWAIRPRKYEFSNFKSFMIILVLLFVYGEVIQCEKDLVLCLKSVVWANIGTALLMVRRIGIANLFAGRAGRALGLNANVFGMQCALAALLAFYLFENDHKKYMIAVVFLSFMALLSGSRKAFIILLAGIVLYETLRMETKYIIRNVLIIVIAMVVFLYAVMRVPQIYDIIGYRLVAVFSEHKDGSMIERSFFKQEAMRLFYERPVLGNGYDSFKTHLLLIRYKHPAYSHCNYTEILATLGIVGAFIYYVMYLYLFIKSCKRKDPLTRMLFVCFLCIIMSEYAVVLYNSAISMILLGLLYFRVNNTRIYDSKKYVWLIDLKEKILYK